MHGPIGSFGQLYLLLLGRSVRLSHQLSFWLPKAELVVFVADINYLSSSSVNRLIFAMKKK